MADPIVGTWDVSLVQGNMVRYRYIYTCTAGRTVRWYDYNDQTENGNGTWSRSGDRINFGWKDSATNEYWIPSPRIDGGGATGLVDASYGKFSILATRLDQADDSKDLIRQWNDAINAGEPFNNPNVCPHAVPYLQFKGPNVAALNPKNIGPSIQKIRGLAIHTTWGRVQCEVETTVSICCNTWNNAGRPTSAHFAIASNGKILQFVPHNRIAWAQGGQSDQYYLSVEIETKNSAANQDQLRAASKLFRWVVGTFNVPPNLATGFVGKSADSDLGRGAKAAFDPITTRMCADAGVATTNDSGVAAAASGLSCHYWLHAVKPCPGAPLLAQMAEIAKG